jgi:PAS domain S-box-containing protein
LQAGALTRGMPTPLRVLILEDRLDDAELMVAELLAAGFDVTWERVDTAISFRQRLEPPHPHPDLILSDYNLPQFDGLQALELVRSLGLDIPFILVSGTIGEDVAVDAMKRGAADYLIKDRMTRLGAAAAQALESRRLRVEKRNAEQALRQAEENYRTLVEQIPAVTYVVTYGNPNRTTYISPQIESLLGFTPEEWLADPDLWINRVHPDDRARVLAEVERIDHTGEALNIEYRTLHRDGRTLWIKNQAAILRDDAGKPRYTQGIMSDVTERVHRETELLALATVSAALRTAATRADILPILLDQTLTLLDAQGALIDMRDPASDGMLVELGRGVWSELTGLRTRMEPSLSYSAFAKNPPPSLVNRTTTHSNDNPQWPLLPMLNGAQTVSALPLIARDQLVGMLWIGRNAEIADHELRLLTAVSELAANAIYRATLHEQTERHSKQLAAVNTLGHALAQTLDLPQIYERLHEATNELWPDVAVLLISLYDSAHETINSVFGVSDAARIDVSQFPSEALSLPGEGAQSQVIHSRQPLNLGDWQAHLSTLPENSFTGYTTRPALGGARPTRSALFAPMLAHDRVIGVIQVHSDALNRYGWTDVELLSFVANTAAVAIENARLFAETKRRLEHVESLRVIDVAISTNTNLRAALTVLLERTISQLHMDAVAVLTLEPDSGVLAFAAGQGFESPQIEISHLRLGTGFVGRALSEQRPAHIPDAKGAPLSFERAQVMAADDFQVYYSLPLTAKNEVKGLLEIYNHAPLSPDAEWFGFLEAVAAQAAIAIDNSNLFNSLQQSNIELISAYETTLEGWSRALDLRDRETEGHTRRVTELTVFLARRMGFTEAEIVQIRRGALLHDIGKMGIPDSILQKRGTLTFDEMELMRKHPTYAYNLLWPITFLHPALDIPYCHHEKWNGAGYPRGLKGEEIPLAARIFAVVDVWDALTSDRRYSPAWPKTDAREYIRQEAGKHFEPRIAELFLNLEAEWQDEQEANRRSPMEPG